MISVGDHVRKNPDTWIPNVFDVHGRGEGTGEVVEPPFYLEPELVDVRWPGGRYFEFVAQLQKAG